MPDDADEVVTDIQFIPAFEDARLRLDCFVAVRDLPGDRLKMAQELYAWVMETEAEAEGEKDSQLAIVEDQRDKRH